jgi:hypothetical protein
MVNYGLEDPGFESRHSVSAAHAAPHSTGAEALPLGVRRSWREVTFHLHFHLVARLGMSKYPHFPCMSSGCVQLTISSFFCLYLNYHQVYSAEHRRQQTTSRLNKRTQHLFVSTKAARALRHDKPAPNLYCSRSDRNAPPHQGSFPESNLSN